ncbi:unnamed protein product, partial [marine sediment metagenome]
HNAIATVPEIFKRGLRPTALEFVQEDAVTIAEKKSEKKSHFSGGKAYLMIEINSASEEELERMAETIAEICEQNNCVDVFLAEKKDQQEVWETRGKFYELLKEYTIEFLDVVVPPAQIANHVDQVQRISEKYGMWLPTYGHAGDGNLHTHVMKARLNGGNVEWLDESEWKERYPKVRDKIHADALSREGLVSGEHGIGIIKKKYLPLFF